MALHEVQLKGYSVRPGNLSLGTFGSYGIEQLHVTLDDTWSGLAVTATFNPPKGEPREIRLPENGLIDVPAEATANEGTGTIVYCGVANGVQRITKTQGYNVITRGPVGGTEPFKPSESLATQVLQAALNAEKNSAEAKSVADNLRNDAANGKFDGKDGAKGDKGDTGDKGNTGAKGDKGDKGFSPTAAVTQLENGAEITITDEEGTTKATVKNGSKGDKGDRGSDGVSPTISVEDIENGHRVTIVDATGTTSVDIYNGEDGTDGKDGAQVDDSSIGDKPWSSKHIIDMLCPPLEESGNPVVCYPVAGYALGVKAKWELMQEGTGTPSPENIRPIHGRDSVTVNRADGLRAWKMLTLDGTERWIMGTSVEGIYSFYVPNAVTDTPIATTSTEVCTHYKILNYNDGTESAFLSNEPYAYINTGRFNSVEELKAYLATQHAAGTPVQIAYKLKKPAVVPDTNGIFFSEQPAQGGAGDPSPENIRPILLNNTVQVGQTNALTLPETVYGGEVDAVTGDGNKNTKIITLDGNELKFSLYNNFSYNLPAHSTPGISAQGVICCSHLDAKFFGANANYEFCFLNKSNIDGLFANADTLNDYLAAQYAAGTPVQVAYKLAESTPFTATGAQPIPALAGANTVLTDTDSATVTGRADPIKRITDLEDAVASQT